MRSPRLLPLVLIGLSLALPAAALGAPGDLDPSYGTGGRAELGLTGTTEVYGMTVDPQGRAILVGETESSGYVERLLPDGLPDPTFDGTGVVLLPKGGADLRAVAVQPDGKIVAVGAHGVSSEDPGDLDVYRFREDGASDPAFGSAGRVTISLPGQQGGNDVAIEPDGKIVVGGFSWPVGSDDGMIWRLLPDGAPDPSFSADGMQPLHTGGMVYGVALALAPEGKLILAGRSLNTNQGVVFRVDADGTPDPSFGPGGARLTAPGPHDAFEAVAVRPDGSVLAAGFSTTGSATDPIVQEFAPDGSAESSFAGTGRSEIPIGPGAFTGASVLQPDGKLIVVGRTESGGEQVFAFRLLPTGELDPTFGDGGLRLIPTAEVGEVKGAALQPDGNLVVAGVADYQGFVYRLVGGPFPTPLVPANPGEAPAPGGPGSGPVPAVPPRPTISHLLLTPSHFRVARSVAMISRLTRRGTRIGFSTSVAGTIRLSIAKLVVRHHRLRPVPIGSIGGGPEIGPGPHVKKFTGRVRRRALPPGRYRLTVTETVAGTEVSPSVSGSFTVLR